MYQMLATLAAGSQMPAHSHPQEQIVHILEGKMRLIVEGVPHELSPATRFIWRVMFRMVWKRSRQRVCSTRLVRRDLITSRWTRKFKGRAGCPLHAVQRTATECRPYQRRLSAFRLVGDSQHNFSARVMRRRLLLRLYRITQRKNFRHDWFNFS